MDRWTVDLVLRTRMKTWILLLLGLVSAQVTSGAIAPPTVYQVKEDDSVTIRWDVDSDANTTLTHLLCTHLSSGLRVLYQLAAGVELQEAQHQQFAQRVAFDKDALRANQIRLRLSRVSVADSGRYLCEVRADYDQRTSTWRLSTSKYFVLEVTPSGTRDYEDLDSPESRPEDTVKPETLNKLERGADAGFVLLIAAVLVFIAAAAQALSFFLRPKDKDGDSCSFVQLRTKIRTKTVEV